MKKWSTFGLQSCSPSRYAEDLALKSCFLCFLFCRNAGDRGKLYTFGGGSRTCIGQRVIFSGLKVNESIFSDNLDSVINFLRYFFPLRFFIFIFYLFHLSVHFTVVKMVCRMLINEFSWEVENVSEVKLKYLPVLRPKEPLIVKFKPRWKWRTWESNFWDPWFNYPPNLV